jgi:hypothetical protein
VTGAKTYIQTHAARQAKAWPTVAAGSIPLPAPPPQDSGVPRVAQVFSRDASQAYSGSLLSHCSRQAQVCSVIEVGVAVVEILRILETHCGGRGVGCGAAAFDKEDWEP